MTFGDIGLLEAARGDADAASVAYERARQLTPGPWFGGMGGAFRKNEAASTSPPFQGAFDPAAPDPLPGTSEAGLPVIVIETGVDVRKGDGPPSTVITGAIKTSPDGGTTVQFTAVDGGTGRSIDALATVAGSASTPLDVTAVPEPASLLLLLGGGMVGGGSRWLQRRRAKRAV